MRRFGKIAAPRSYDPKGPAPREYLAYLSPQEMRALMVWGGREAPAWHAGLPSFPPSGTTGKSSQAATGFGGNVNRAGPSGAGVAAASRSSSAGGSTANRGSGGNQPAGMRTSPAAAGAAARNAAAASAQSMGTRGGVQNPAARAAVAGLSSGGNINAGGARAVGFSGTQAGQQGLAARALNSLPRPTSHPLRDETRFVDESGRQLSLRGMEPGAIATMIDYHGLLNQSTPLVVRSTYRNPLLNKRVGGAKGSAHMAGKAFDLNLADSSIAGTNRAIALARQAGFGGIGVYRPGSIHVDTAGVRDWGPTYSSASTPGWARAAVATPIGTMTAAARPSVSRPVQTASLTPAYAGAGIPIPGPRPAAPFVSARETSNTGMMPPAALLAAAPGNRTLKGLSRTPVAMSQVPAYAGINRAAKGSAGLPPDSIMAGLTPAEQRRLLEHVTTGRPAGVPPRTAASAPAARSPALPSASPDISALEFAPQSQTAFTTPNRPVPAYAGMAEITSGIGGRGRLAARTAAFPPPQAPALPARIGRTPAFGMARSAARGSPAAPVPDVVAGYDPLSPRTRGSVTAPARRDPLPAYAGIEAGLGAAIDNPPLTPEQETAVTNRILDMVNSPWWRATGQRNRNVLAGRNPFSGREASKGGDRDRMTPRRQRLIAALTNPDQSPFWFRWNQGTA